MKDKGFATELLSDAKHKQITCEVGLVLSWIVIAFLLAKRN
jgi:hypothetical protein